MWTVTVFGAPWSHRPGSRTRYNSCLYCSLVTTASTMSDNRSSAYAPASIRREKCIIVAGLSGRSLASKPSLATILGWFFTRFFTRGDVADPETTDILANASWRFSHLPQSRGSQILIYAAGEALHMYSLTIASVCSLSCPLIHGRWSG